MSFIEYIAKAAENVSLGIEIISGISQGSSVNNPSTGRPNLGAAIRPGSMIPGQPNGHGILPPNLIGEIIPMAEILPNLPPGTIGLVIPEGVVATVIDGVLTLIEEGQLTLAEGGTSFETEPAHSYEISGNNYQGHADFLSHSGSAQGTILINDQGQIIGEGSAEWEAMIFDAEISGSIGGLEYDASGQMGAYANAEGSFVVDPLAGTVHAQASVGAGVEIGVEASAVYDLPEGLGTAYANGHATAGAYLEADGNIEIDLAEGVIMAEGSFNAFAGAEAGFEAGIDTDLVDVTATGGVYAGIGVSGSGHIGYEDGIFSLGGAFGVAFKVGGHFGVDVSVDVGNIVENAVGAVQNIGEAFSDIASGDIAGGINNALDSIENATEIVSDAVDTITGTASGLVSAGTGLVAGIFDAVGLDSFADSVESVGGFVSGAIDGFGTVTTGIVDGIGDIADGIGDGVEAVGGFISGAASAVGSFVGGAVSAIGSFFSGW